MGTAAQLATQGRGDIGQAIAVGPVKTGRFRTYEQCWLAARCIGWSRGREPSLLPFWYDARAWAGSRLVWRTPPPRARRGAYSRAGHTVRAVLTDRGLELIGPFDQACEQSVGALVLAGSA